MVKVKSRGTVFQQEVSMTYTAIAQLDSIAFSGFESETFDCTTLDGAVGKALAPTGYSEVGEVSISGFYDPVLASQTNLRDLVSAPAETNFKVIFADTATTELGFAGAGFSWESTVAMSDGLKFASTIKITGLPTWS